MTRPAYRRVPPSFSRLGGPALVLALGAAAYLPLVLNPGLLNTRAGGDSPFLLVRLHQMVAALQDGVFPVRWMPDAAYGLGYPFFNYYAPLAYYLSAGVYFLGFGYLSALKLVQVAGFVVAGLAMYRLAFDTFRSRPAGVLAGLTYTFAPFHLVNVYVRGDSLGEFWAFAFYPLIILALRRLRAHPSVANSAWLGLAYAGLVLSHNLSAFMFTPFLALYALVLPLSPPPSPAAVGDGWGGGRPPLRLYVLIAVGLALGVALSAFYWLPAVAEQAAVQLQGNLTGYFDFHGHFRDDDLVQAGLAFNYELGKQGAAFAAGLVQTGLALAGSLALVVHWLRRRRVVLEPALALVTTATAVFLVTSFSEPLWTYIPLLPFVQFPWRFLSIAAFGGSLLAGALASHVLVGGTSARSSALRWAVALAASALSLWSATARLPVDFLPISDADVTAERLMQYEWFTGNIGSTIRAEYLPVQVPIRPYSSSNFLDPQMKAAPNVTSGSASATLLRRGAADQLWQVDVASAQAGLAFHTLWFPGWRATVDGAAAASGPVPGSGLIGLTLPAGRHTVRLALGRTPARLAGELLSLSALLALGILALAARSRRAGVPNSSTQSSTLFILFTLLILFPVLPNLLPPSPDGGLRQERGLGGEDLTWDFNRMPYLHPNPAGQPLGDLRLTGYELSPAAVVPGSALTVTLTWQPAPAGKRVTVALVTSPQPRVDGVETITSSARLPLAPAMTVRLDLPRTLSRGVYLVRVHVGGEDDVFLAPVTVQAQPSSAEPPGASPIGDAITLSDLAVERTGGTSLFATMTWHTERPLGVSYRSSVRFLGPDGAELAVDDAQPLYGFLPATAWRPGEAVYDRRRLDLPKGLPAGSGYTLRVILYDPASLQQVGQADLPGVMLTEPTR